MTTLLDLQKPFKQMHCEEFTKIPLNNETRVILQNILENIQNNVYIHEKEEPIFQEDYADILKDLLNHDIDTSRKVFNNSVHASLLNAPSYVQFIIPKEEHIKKNKDLSKQLGINVTRLKIYVQKPGHLVPLHYDRLKEHATHRGVIFLTDWENGQCFQLGDEFLKWKAMDYIYTWQMSETVHGTANFGYKDRITLIVDFNQLIG